jgi:hypothetical protein
MEENKMYFIRYRLGEQRIDRSAVMLFMGSTKTDYVFSARPVAGTQRLPKSALIGTPREVPMSSRVYINKKLFGQQG